MKKTYDVHGNIIKEELSLSKQLDLEFTKMCAMIVAIASLFVIFFVFSFIRIDKQLVHISTEADIINERYEDLVYENETLWKYIENIDTFKTLDDAIEYRDDLVEQLQFIDE